MNYEIHSGKGKIGYRDFEDNLSKVNCFGFYGLSYFF